MGWSDRKRKEREAAQAVQKAWSDQLDKELDEIGALPPEGMKARLLEAVGETEDTKASSGKNAAQRRPLRRAAAAVLGVLMILGAWLAFDKTARAEAGEWLRSVFGTQIQMENDAVNAGQRLRDFLGGEPYMQKYYRSAKGGDYRPYYGGCYLNDEKYLVVNVTDDSPNILKVFRDVMHYDRVLFQKVDYSADELYRVQVAIERKMEEDPFVGISMYGVDERRNRVEVCFGEEGQEIRDAFLTWLGEDLADKVWLREEAVETIIDLPGEEDNDREAVRALIEKDLVNGSRLKKLGDAEAAVTEAERPSGQAIEEYMQRQVSLFPEITKLDKEIVEDGDLLRLSYGIYSETLWYTSVDKAPELPVRCGAETAFGLEDIQTSVKGRKVGETYTIPYTGGMFDAGEPLFCDITILYIYTTEAAQLNDAFVQAHTAYRTVEEWRSALYREEWIANRGPAWEKAFNQLMAESSFALDEKKIEKNAADPEQAKMRVREYLLIKALADHFGLTVSAEDLNDYCARQHVRIELLSLAEQEACEWCALREKVMNRMTGIE